MKRVKNMLKYGDTVKIKTIVKLYGRGEGLVAMLEEIKSKDMTGKVISIDKEDCILDTYVSFEGYDNIWMSEEDELEKVSGYNNLKIVENIDSFIETLKNIHEEEVGEVELEEVELDEVLDIKETKKEETKEVDNMDKKLLNYLIAKFNYGSIEEVLDDYYEDKLVEYIRKDNMLFEDKDEFAVMRTVETILDLFELNRDDIKEALDKKEMKRIVRKMNDDDLEF
jgi:hypothetical protein